MKRMIAILLATMALSGVLAGCSGSGDNNTVSTTPNGTVNGGSSTAADDTYAPDSSTNSPAKNHSGDTANSNTYNDDTAPNPGTSQNADHDNNMIEEFGQDMERAMEDTGDMVEDAVEGRSKHTGTGMTGGR